MRTQKKWFLIFIFCWSGTISYVQGQTNPLNQKVSITFENQSIGEAFRQLGQETGYSINYSSSKSAVNRRITKKYVHIRLADIIKEIWGDNQIKLEAQGRTIDLLIIKKPKKLGKGSLQGQVIDDNRQPIPFAAVAVEGANKWVVTDEEGNFEIQGIPEGPRVLAISSMGYKPKKQEVLIQPNETLRLNIRVPVAVKELDEVVVVGQSEATRKSVEPIQVTVLESKELQDQPIGAQDLIKRSTGVQIREQGGLGSNVSVNLNGLSGRAVRIYYDGIPVEFLGNGLALNALPIGLIDRVDIYKGVIPVDVATDALGGAINIIPRQIKGDYLEASYQLGSFNTHRASFIGRHKISPKISVGLNGFYNYSDNNYKIRDVPNATFEEGVFVENVIDTRRFHDVHRSFSVEGQAEIYNKKWADLLSVAVSYTDRFDEIQHGPRLSRRPYGEVEILSDQWVGIVKYSKRFGERWDFSQKSSFSLTRTFVDDSTMNIYDWNGNLLPSSDRGGAEIGNPTNRRGTTVSTTHRSTVHYTFHEKHYLVASNFFGYNEVSGKDPYVIPVTVGNSTIDPNQIKSPLRRNIFGLQYEATWLKGGQLTSTAFYKHYHVNGETVNFSFTGGAVRDKLSVVSIKKSYHGGGVGFKYNLNKRFFLRTSYERTIRIPSISEFFGNFATIAQNQELLPERGHNGNLGVNFKTRKNTNVRFDVDLNAFIRDQQDRIRLDAPSPNFSQFINDERVLSRGAELTTNVWPVKNLKFNLNFTYQRVTITDTDKDDESTIGFDLPNISDLFFNTSVSYTIPTLFNQDDQLKFSWDYFFVDRFSIAFVKDLDTANPANIVPVQHDHAVGLSYTDTGKGLTFSARLNNVFDRILFDNFRAPKPSRNIMFKILYQLNKNR